MRSLVPLIALVLLGGCTTYGTSIQDVPGRPVREVPVSRPGIMAGTGPEASDIEYLADSMMRDLLSAPVIAQATHAPTVALLPLDDRTRFRLANPDIFLNRLRGELNGRATGRMIFLARDRIEDVFAERDLQRQGVFTSNPENRQVAPAGADYFLTGAMESLTQGGPRGEVEDYILYSFQLIDPESSAIVWEGQYSVQRAAQYDSVYR